LNNRQFLINSVLTGINACQVVANQSGIYLLSDNGSALLGPLNGSGSLSNSQCTLIGSATNVQNGGNNSVLTLLISFKAVFAGPKNIYMSADDIEGINSGWQTLGSFTAVAPQPTRINLTVFRPTGSNWFVNTGSGQTILQQWGLAGDMPLTGDFDGDGTLDYAVFRPSTAEWFIIPSSAPGAVIYKQWGLVNDVPVPGDYDGDGRTDIAVWRPGAGFAYWFVVPSSNPGSPIVMQWGLSGDKPVVADFDGDGKADFGVWRPSSGFWYIVPSSAPATLITQQWGLPGDEPVPGDYDGDHKADIAVYRPANQTWFIVPSTAPLTSYCSTMGSCERRSGAA
jgi:hypothetical protein